MEFGTSMIPKGACYTIRNAEQQPYAFGNVATQIPAILLASLVGGVGLIVISIAIFMKKPPKQGKG
jgi:hypothetical protein